MLASGASVSDGTVWTGRLMMELTGPSTDARTRHHLVAQVHVGDDAEPVASLHQQRRDVLRRHQRGRVRDARLGSAEDRRVMQQGRDRARAHVRQRAHGPGRVDQPRPQPARHEPHARGPAQDLEPDVGRDAVDRGVLEGPGGELGRLTREEGRVPEHPATVHDGDGDPLVLEVEGAPGDHVQLLADLAALDEDHLALGDPPRGHGGGDPLALFRVELLERLVPREERGARRGLRGGVVGRGLHCRGVSHSPRDP